MSGCYHVAAQVVGHADKGETIVWWCARCGAIAEASPGQQPLSPHWTQPALTRKPDSHPMVGAAVSNIGGGDFRGPSGPVPNRGGAGVTTATGLFVHFGNHGLTCWLDADRTMEWACCTAVARGELAVKLTVELNALLEEHGRETAELYSHEQHGSYLLLRVSQE